MIERNLQTFQYMRPVFRLSQFKFGSTPYYLLSMLDVLTQDVLETQYAGLDAIYQRHHIVVEACLERRQLIELIEQLFGICVFL
jgi:hypothetical protein